VSPSQIGPSFSRGRDGVASQINEVVGRYIVNQHVVHNRGGNNVRGGMRGGSNISRGNHTINNRNTTTTSAAEGNRESANFMRGSGRVRGNNVINNGRGIIRGNSNSKSNSNTKINSITNDIND